jgi:hypothetical protein
MDEVIGRLTVGVHPVAICEPWIKKLQDHLEEPGYLQITFGQISGASGIGVNLDREECNWATADFEGRKGEVHLEGTVVLDCRTLRCVAYIDLSTMDGTGYLVLLEEPSSADLRFCPSPARRAAAYADRR